ncbi:MAG TPA: branched-chain amino acid ABC transporter permease [Methanothermococcus okinawensis]|nr:branched-chain amino acid ABC transporter permease [Methanothermococcus okinawensis]
MFIKGVIASIPIALGYIPVAITFGLTALTLGFNKVEILLASALIFGGASQFALISLMPSSFVDAVIVPLLLNLRYTIYSCIISQKFAIKYPFIVAFGLTDEVFAISLNAPNSEEFILGLELGAYLSWILGTLIGVLGGSILLSNKILMPSLTFSLTALFLVLLIPNLKGYHILSAMIGGSISLLFHYLGYTSVGILLAGILTPIVLLKIKVKG